VNKDRELISLGELRWFTGELKDFDTPDFTIWQAIVVILDAEGYGKGIYNDFIKLLDQVERDSYEQVENLYFQEGIEFYQHNGKPFFRKGDTVKSMAKEDLGSIFIDVDCAESFLKHLNINRYAAVCRFHAPHFIFTTLYTEIIRSVSGESCLIKHNCFLDNKHFDDVIHTAAFSEAALGKWKALIKENQLGDFDIFFSKSFYKKKSYEIDSDKGLITVLIKLLSKVMGDRFLKSSGEINLSALTDFICLNVPSSEIFIKKRRLTDLFQNYLEDYDVQTMSHVYLKDRGEKTLIMDDKFVPVSKESGPIQGKYIKPPQKSKK
jgi:hypothetical protein